jgi:hypothetical protein
LRLKARRRVDSHSIREITMMIQVQDEPDRLVLQCYYQ